MDDEAKAGPIQLYEVHGCKIHKHLNREQAVISISDYTSIVAERVPPENLENDDDGTMIQAFHFQAEPSKSHGIPFLFRVKRVCGNYILAGDPWRLTFHQGEKFVDTKKRLEQRTGLKVWILFSFSYIEAFPKLVEHVSEYLLCVYWAC